MKKVKCIFILFIATLLFTNNVGATSGKIRVKYAQVIGGSSGSSTAKSDYCYTNGCRTTSKFGLKVSVLYCNESKTSCSITASETLKKINEATSIMLPYADDDTKNVNADNKKEYTGFLYDNYTKLDDYFKVAKSQMTTMNNNAKTGKYDSSKAFADDFKKTIVYQLLKYLNSSKYAIDDSLLNTNPITDKTKINSSYTLKKYQKLINNTYIVFEPTMEAYIPTNDFAYAIYTDDGKAMIDADIKDFQTKYSSVGTFDTVENFLYTGAIGMSSGKLYYKEEIVKDDKLVTGQGGRSCLKVNNGLGDVIPENVPGTIPGTYTCKYTKYETTLTDATKKAKAENAIKAWQALGKCNPEKPGDCAQQLYGWLNSTDTKNEAREIMNYWNALMNLKLETISGTVKEIAQKIMQNGRYERAGADSNGNYVSNQPSGSGSISSRIKDISIYRYVDEPIAWYTAATKAGTSNWKTLGNKTSGYGVNVMDPRIDYELGDTSSMCVFDEETQTIIPPKIKYVSGPDEKKGQYVDKDYCCDNEILKSDGSTTNIRPWGDDTTGLTKFMMTNEYKQICPTTTKNKCGVSEYNYIEKNGNSILKNDIPGLTVIDKTTGKERQAKYEDCCTADYYDLPLKDGKTKITKDDIDFLNENFCKPKQCGVDEIKSLLGLSSDDPNKLNALECCNISAFEGNEEFLNSTIKINNKNKVVKTLFDSESGILKNAEKYCPITSGVCTFTDTIAKGIRYKNGVEKAENDCCNWDNYGKTKEEKMKNSKATYNGTTKTFDTAASFTKFIVSIPEYSKVCPNTKCTKTDLLNILSGTETDKEKIEKCCVKTGYDDITLNSKIDGKLVSSFFTKDGNTKLNSKLCHSDYCTLESVAEGNTECCTKPMGSGLSAYSKEDKLKYSTESGLETALINYLGKKEYYRLCKGPDCYYDVDGDCPNCDSDLHSSGETADLVRGEDSTKLDVETEIKNCIVKNSDYLSSTNDLSSKYCKVYCTQKVEYNYPKKSTLNVSAGRYILVGGSSGYTGVFAPIQTKVVMTCRVTDINEAQFKSDLAKAVDRYKKAYDAYSNAKIPLQNKGTAANMKILNTVTENKSGSATCDCKNWQKLGDHDEACCTSQETVTITLQNKNLAPGALTQDTKDSIKSCSSYSQTLTPTVSSKKQCTDACGNLGVQDYHYICTYPNGNTAEGKDETATCYGNAGKDENGIKHRGTPTYYCTCKNKCEEYSYSCKDDTYTLTGDNTKCVSYSCANEITYNGQKAYLVKSKSSYGPTLSPQCVYAYCTGRNYERYPYQTVTEYNYGVDNDLQTARSTRQCSANCNGSSNCKENPNYYESVLNDALTKAQKELKEAKAYYDSVIENYSKCFKVNENIKDAIDVNIDFNLNYENGPYSLNTKLKKQDEEPDITSDYETKESSAYEQCVFSNDKLICKKKSLENTKGEKVKVYKDFSRINSVRMEKEYNYYLPDNADVYTSVNKSSKSKLSKEKEMNNFDIGKHLPVAYNEKDNDIVVTLIPTVTSNKLRSSEFKTKLCTNQYECTAKPGGTGCIIPVYRPIDLNNPFPDQNFLNTGESNNRGRQTGTNWCASDSTGCSNTNTLVKKVITNNRGVTTNEVYKLTPLYTIRLTPSMISQIRDYNKDTTYGDYNLICDEGTGKHCISRYLRGEEDENGNVLKNNLKAIGAIIPSQSCALTENLNGCKPNDYYKTKID